MIARSGDHEIEIYRVATLFRLISNSQRFARAEDRVGIQIFITFDVERGRERFVTLG